jgi:N-carbamoyl-L-amino-acid hydrolase
MNEGGAQPLVAVSGERLSARLAALARIGATPGGGVNRQALTAEDGRARALVAHWAHSRGFHVAQDAIGNLFIRRDGAEPALAPVLTGSHLDTQPAGGRFDGAYGVAAGFEVLEALADAAVSTRRAIEVVAWTNEEGCRFQPGCMGSAVFTGALPLADALAARDESGTTVAAALAALTSGAGNASIDVGREIAAYVEAHIEQGPVLEENRCTIGVVTGIHGARWYAVEVEGEAGHAGTTPMRGRKDALAAALRIIANMTEAIEPDSAAIRFTVGRMVVWPNSPNTIPARATFTVDLRSSEETLLERHAQRLRTLATNAVLPCRAVVHETFRSPPVPFASEVQARIASVASELGLAAMRMPSGAFHDALFLSRRCRTGMIFVPCAQGISHNEAEHAEEHDLEAGVRTLACVLQGLANE